MSRSVQCRRVSGATSSASLDAQFDEIARRHESPSPRTAPSTAKIDDEFERYFHQRDLMRHFGGPPKGVIGEQYERIAQTSDHSEAQLRLGQVFEEIGKTAHAKQAYRRAIMLRESNGEAYFRLGGLYAAKGEKQTAELLFRAVEVFDPKSRFVKKATRKKVRVKRRVRVRKTRIQPLSKSKSKLSSSSRSQGETTM